MNFMIVFLLFSKSEQVLNPFDITTMVVIIFWSMMAIFLVCEIGERLTKEFSAFEESLIQSDWYAYPNGMRRIFALILANAQKPVIVQGFGSTFCVREYFRLVIALFFAQFKWPTQTQIHLIFILFSAIDTSKKLLLFSDTSSSKLGIVIVIFAIIKFVLLLSY